MRLTGALRSIAAVETVKGAMGVALALTFASMVGQDISHAAQRLTTRLHLDPAGRYMGPFVRSASLFTSSHLWLFALAALLYALLRFVEAYGLWGGRRWAEWFAALSAGIYLPFELYETLFHFGWLVFSALLVNLAIVAFMTAALWRERAF